ncbi:MAG: polysaccharide export protein [Myxococcales bacterium]|nr:polysaccharide export protein [Myxococcales bacterium]
MHLNLMKNRSAAVVVGATAWLVSGCFSSAPTIENPSPSFQTAGYRVAPADLLTVVLLPEPGEMSLVVRPDGRVSVEMVGEIGVRGKTIPEIERAIEEAAKSLVVYPQVSVSLAESRSRRFFILGEVSNPGSYELIADMRVLDALFAAQGPTLLAARNASSLVRPGVGAFAVNFEDIAEYGIGETNYALRPGDVVNVPPNWFGKTGHAIQTALYPISSILDYTLRVLTLEAIWGDN